MGKHYVYSARTTEKGLAILNKAKGKMSWDQFVNEAVSAHYKLDGKVIALPPSEFLAKQAAAKVKKAEDKAQKALDRKGAADKKAADKKNAKAKADKAPAKDEKDTESVTVNPGEHVTTTAGERITAAKDNTGPMAVPTKGKAVKKGK